MRYWLLLAVALGFFALGTLWGRPWRLPQPDVEAATALVQALRTGTLQCTNDQIIFEAPTADVTVLVIPHVPTASVIEIRNVSHSLFAHVYVRPLGRPALFSPAIALATNYVQKRRADWVEESEPMILLREVGDEKEH